MAGIETINKIDDLAPNGNLRGPVNTPLNDPGGTTRYTSSQDITIIGGPIDVALVAGGGSGNGSAAGGGGAGVVLQPARPIAAGTYPLVIGNGGSSSPGGDSTFDGLTAKGGGRAYTHEPYDPAVGDPGGSGGGVGRGNRSGSGGTGIQPTQPGDSGTYGNGNPAGGAAYQGGSGGGGAGGSSGYAGSQGGTNGGPGVSIAPVFGAAPQPFYGPTADLYGGGGGGRYNSGGPGGGGPQGNPGTPESGGGGGGQPGGSGVAYIKTPAFNRLGGLWTLNVVLNAVRDGNWV